MSQDVTNVRVEEIWLMTGKKPNPLHLQLNAIEQRTRIHQIHRNKIDKINCTIKQLLQTMKASELRNWWQAAWSIEDLKKQEQRPSFRIF